MVRQLHKGAALFLALVLCLSPGAAAVENATEGAPVIPEGQDEIYYDDFSGGGLNSGWDLYGSGAEISQQDGVLAVDIAITPGENGQTGPRYTIPLETSASWQSREITISWKMYSEVQRGVRLNLSPGPDVKDNQEVNIFGSWGILDNCPAQTWTNYTASRLVEGDMTSGDFTFFFKLNGESGKVYFDDVLVTVSAAKPSIFTESLEAGVMSVPYEQHLDAGGSQPMSWSVESGTLPAGLTLSGEGVISGTPEAAVENASFTVKVENSLGSDSKELTLTITEVDNLFTLTQTVGKSIGDGNALYTQHFGADPWAMEYDGRLYIYMTNDIYEYDAEGNILDNSYSKIRHINVISSADLVNWTDHGSIPVAGGQGIAKWANNSWAPCAVWRNENGSDKFYLYFTNGGGGIGVLVGDSPVGPWTDPNGKALVSHATENCSGNLVPWCFDPAVFIDDDGQGYLYFGGGVDNLDPSNPKSGRVVKLKENLTEIDGVPQEVAPYFFFEASAMHKYNGTYYFTYSANFSSRAGASADAPAAGSIAYLTADNPMGPFTYAGEVFAGPGAFGFGGGNNHQCVFQFKGEWYLAYHGSAVSLDLHGKSGYRSTHIDKLEYDADGKIIKVTGTRKGIDQLQSIDPYTRIEAETIAWNGGIETVMEDPTQQSSINLFVTGLEHGDWLSVAAAELGSTSPKTFTVSAAGERGGTIELRAGSPDPEAANSVLLSTITVPAGDGNEWNTLSAPFETEITGTENLFMVFKGDANNVDLFKLDWWQLGHEASTEPAPESSPEATAEVTPNPTVTPSDSENGAGSEDKKPAGKSPWPWVGVAVGAAALVAGAVVWFRKKK